MKNSKVELSQKIKDYKCIDRVVELQGKYGLQVILQTKEFGDLSSRIVNRTEDADLNVKLLDSLADDIIQEYEDRLKLFKANN
jgi:hypothetical protein